VSGPPATDEGRSRATDEAVATIDDFGKLDLRIAKIVAAEAVEGADNLLKLLVDIGALRS
jgi:methionyl-tRNA synthetase